MCAKSLQSCPTLCDPMDCSPPGSSVHGAAQCLDLFDRVVEYFLHVGGTAGSEVLLRESDFQPLERGLSHAVSCGAYIVVATVGEAGAVHLVRARRRREQRRRVLDRVGEGTDLVQTRREGDQPVARLLPY